MGHLGRAPRRTTVTLRTLRDDRPPDTATTANREYQLTVTPVGPGWHSTHTTVMVYVELTRGGRTWRITQLEQDQ